MSGATGLKGDLSTLKGLNAKIRQMPLSIAHEVAQRSAPVLTGEAQNAYATGRTVYGDARPLGVHGNELTLVRTGLTLSTLRFAATGTIVRCVLGPKYARFLIGKYGILPNGNAAIPARWTALLRGIVDAVFAEQASAIGAVPGEAAA